MSKHKIATELRFKQIRKTIDVALKDDSISEHLKEFGYTNKKLHEGLSLYSKAFELFQNNFIQHKLDNPDDFQSLWNKAYQYYSQLVHISRVALQGERKVFMQLGLSGPRKKSLSGWLSQANQFYINALSNPEIALKLKEYGLSLVKLQSGKKLLDSVEVALISCSKGNGSIQKLALEYDKAIDELECWFDKFNTISRIAFENNPNVYKKLKITIH